MTVDPGYKNVEKFAGVIAWYITETKDVISCNSFKIENENYKMVSFNGQSISLSLSIEEI